jgi:ABC-2 type transport system ATP-binding protein
MDEAETLCDRVGIVDQGRLIALGTPRELIATLGAEHVIEFELEDRALLADATLQLLPGVRDVRRLGGSTSLRVSELHTSVPALLAELEREHRTLSRFATHHASLEDVFVAHTGRHLRDE